MHENIVYTNFSSRMKWKGKKDLDQKIHYIQWVSLNCTQHFLDHGITHFLFELVAIHNWKFIQIPEYNTQEDIC